MGRTARIMRIAMATLLVAGLIGAGGAATGGARIGDRDGMYRLTNDDRVDRSIRGLDLHRRMSELARKHSMKMAARGELFHTQDPVSTYLHGRRWRVWGENVGVTGGTLSGLQSAFMSSTPHRQNILNNRFKDVAVGVARVDGQVWVTVFFYG